jgi:hypothetical protein
MNQKSPFLVNGRAAPQRIVSDIAGYHGSVSIGALRRSTSSGHISEMATIRPGGLLPGIRRSDRS